MCVDAIVMQTVLVAGKITVCVPVNVYSPMNGLSNGHPTKA